MGGKICLAVLFFIISCGNKDNNAAPPPNIPSDTTGTAIFSVKDSKIIDSTGNEFIVKGVNVNGPLWPWTRATIPDISLITQTWHCNAVRVNCWPQNPPYDHADNADLDGIVNGFTNQKTIVIIEDHSFTGVYPNPGQLATAINWWVALAKKYKSNGYVWFNLMNEPGNGGSAPQTWFDVHDAIIQAIRATGANNIIVCDEHSYGQANGFDKPASSAALTFGQALTAKYKNIVFSLHLYTNWTYGKGKLQNYVSAMKTKNLALIFGEYGAGPGTDISSEVASGMFSVAIPEKIGRIAWHWVGQDIYQLTNSSGGFDINNTSGAKPTNLSFGGNLVWDDNHDQLTTGSPQLIPPSIIIANPDFEAHSNTLTDISGWINFGTATLDNSAANVHSGMYALKIPDGSAGGCGQPIYLEPGNYKLTAWGKNSLVAGAPSNMGINYTTGSDPANEVSAVSLSFTETNFTEKSALFTIPAGITGMRIYIYKTEASPAFWVDDISIQKQ